MKAESRLTYFLAVVGLGSCWGLAEATLGHVAHLARVPGLAGGIMFPLACLFMAMGFRGNHGSLRALPVSWVAAGIKLLDLLWPGSTPEMVINPALAILLQGACFHWGWSIRRSDCRAFTLARAAALTLGWRMAQAAVGMVLALAFAHGGILQRGGSGLFSFFIIEGGANVLLVWGLLGPRALAKPLLQGRKVEFSPPLALATLLIAILATVIG